VKEGIEDAIHDSHALRSFLKIDVAEEQVPDAPTLLKFRPPLEKNGIGQVFFEAIHKTLEKCGYMMRGGSIVDVTLIRTPNSTRNALKQRDPEMPSTKYLS
jgi:IS5 family transposase